jgi:hypothetical protein
VQDLEQAKSLLKQAGYDNNLTVELVTSAEALGGDEVSAAQVFAEQAKGAGVTVNVKKTDSATFYGKDYLSWPFAQDFWNTRNYLAQAGQCSMPGGVRDRRRHGAQRAHRSGDDDGVRNRRLHHLVVAEPGRRLLLGHDRRGAGGQARLPAGPVRLQERLFRVR